MPPGPQKEVSENDVLRIEPIPAFTALDITNMANSLANSPFWYRALTNTSENLEWYVQPYSYVPAFNLSGDKIALFSIHSLQNFSATMRSTLGWTPSAKPLGWTLYSHAERIEHFGIILRKKLTDLTYELLSERWVS